MSAGGRVTGPRCLRPMTPYELSRYPGETPDLFPSCHRPLGHPGHRHLSRAAYLRELERALRRNKRAKSRRRQELAA